MAVVDTMVTQTPLVSAPLCCIIGVGWSYLVGVTCIVYNDGECYHCAGAPEKEGGKCIKYTCTCTLSDILIVWLKTIWASCTCICNKPRICVPITVAVWIHLEGRMSYIYMYIVHCDTHVMELGYWCNQNNWAISASINFVPFGQVNSEIVFQREHLYINWSFDHINLLKV